MSPIQLVILTWPWLRGCLRLGLLPAALPLRAPDPACALPAVVRRRAPSTVHERTSRCLQLRPVSDPGCVESTLCRQLRQMQIPERRGQHERVIRGLREQAHQRAAARRHHRQWHAPATRSVPRRFPHPTVSNAHRPVTQQPRKPTSPTRPAIAAHVRHVIERRLVEPPLGLRHDLLCVRALPVRWQVGLAGQVGHSASQRGGQVFQQPLAFEPALPAFEHRQVTHADSGESGCDVDAHARRRMVRPVSESRPCPVPSLIHRSKFGAVVSRSA